MSRTDAHTPWWVRAPWYEPVHHLYCPNYVRRSWQKGLNLKPCDLPESPVRHGGGRTRVYIPRCTWEPVWPVYRHTERLFGRYVPRWYTMHVWFEPERVRERDTLGEMVKEYNANGELADGDFPNYHHGHCARWWWD